METISNDNRLMNKKAGFNLKLHKVARFMWSVFRTMIFIGLGFILLYPVIYMLSIAFRPVEEVMDPGIVWIPKHLTLDNFKTTVKVMDYPVALFNTVTIGVFSAMMQVVSCAVAGYGFARFKFKERNMLFALVLFTILVPPQTITIPTYLQYKNFDVLGILGFIGRLTGNGIALNLLDSRLAFYLPSLLGMGIRSGLYIYVYRQFFRGMPKELEDAALIDGCGAFKTFTRVMLPNAKAVILTVFLFSIVWHWNDYYHAAMYLSSKLTIATSLANLRQSLKTQGINIYDPFMLVTRMQMGSLLTILPLLILYTFTQKHFTESIERSGIVG